MLSQLVAATCPKSQAERAGAMMERISRAISSAEFIRD